MSDGSLLVSMKKRVKAPYIYNLIAVIVLLVIILLVVRFTDTVQSAGPEPGAGLSAVPVKVTVWAGAAVSARDFVTDITGDDVTVSFAGIKPDTFKNGPNSVVTILEDKYGNTQRVTSDLYVYTPKSVLTAEIGRDPATLTAAEFIDGEIQSGDEGRIVLSTPPDEIDMSKIGRVEVVLLLDGAPPPRKTYIDVRDFKTPRGEPVTLTLWAAGELDPNDFVTGIEDQTEVTVTFKQEPDMTIRGRQTVYILLTDECGNTSEIISVLYLEHDDEPPEITGNVKKSVIMGNTILYREGITVTDNIDENVTLEVDSSAVDPNTPGVYPVIYSATDAAGNTTVVEGSMTIFPATAGDIDAKIDAVIAQIIRPEMSPAEKARTISLFVMRQLVYGTGNVRGNVPYAAYIALTIGAGDCYYYYALSEMLLTRAGIENIPIQRVAGYPTMHYWNLVNIDGSWYHFDSMHGRYMFTDSEAERLTEHEALYGNNLIQGYYVYDKSLYPEIAP